MATLGYAKTPATGRRSQSCVSETSPGLISTETVSLDPSTNNNEDSQGRAVESKALIGSSCMVHLSGSISRYLRADATRPRLRLRLLLVERESISFSPAFSREGTGGHLGRQTRHLLRLIHVPNSHASPTPVRAVPQTPSKVCEQLPDQAHLPYPAAPLFVSRRQLQFTVAVGPAASVEMAVPALIARLPEPLMR